VGHDTFEPKLRMLSKARGEGGKGMRVVPRNTLPRHAGVNFQMKQHWFLITRLRRCSREPGKLLQRTKHRGEAGANNLCGFPDEKTGEHQQAMIRELGGKHAGFVQGCDGKPAAAIGSEGDECFRGAVAVSIGFDDCDNLRIDARGPSAQDGIVAEQCATRNLCPCGPGGGG
jgi:hypothetical protein